MMSNLEQELRPAVQMLTSTDRFKESYSRPIDLIGGATLNIVCSFFDRLIKLYQCEKVWRILFTPFRFSQQISDEMVPKHVFYF